MFILRFILLDLLLDIWRFPIMTYADIGRLCISDGLMGTLVTEQSCSICCEIYRGELYIPVLVISTR